MALSLEGRSSAPQGQLKRLRLYMGVCPNARKHSKGHSSVCKRWCEGLTAPSCCCLLGWDGGGAGALAQDRDALLSLVLC